jgi:O-antigen ligase
MMDINIFDFRKSGILMLTLYICLYPLFNDIGVPLIYPSLLLVVVVFLQMAQSLLMVRKIKINRLTLLWGGFALSVILLMVLKGDIYSKHSQSYLVMCIVSLAIVLFSKEDKKICLCIKNIIITTGMIINLFIITSVLCPIYFKQLIYPFITNEAVVYNERILNEGYSFAVACSISYTLCFVILALGMLLINKKRITYITIIKILFLYIGIIMAGRRTEMIVGSILILLTCYSRYKYYVKIFVKKHLLFLMICMFLSLLCGIYIIYILKELAGAGVIHSRYILTILQLDSNADISNGRFVLYALAWNTFLDNYVWGIGWGNFGNIAYKSGSDLAINVHDIYLQLFLETGVIVAPCLILLLVVILIKMIKNYKYNKNAMIGIFIMLYILLAGISDNTLYYYTFWPLGAIGVYFSSLQT